MNGAAVRGLINRRGTLIGWRHAIAPDPSTIDPITLGPKASVGEPGSDGGPFGERYMLPVNIKAFISNKSDAAQAQPYGMVEVGDRQLDFALPFQPNLGASIDRISPELERAYNEGDFAVVHRTGYDERTVVFDRFIILGKIYVAKAKPVPLIDGNVKFAWRLMVGEVTSG